MVFQRLNKVVLVNREEKILEKIKKKKKKKKKELNWFRKLEKGMGGGGHRRPTKPSQPPILASLTC